MGGDGDLSTYIIAWVGKMISHLDWTSSTAGPIATRENREEVWGRQTQPAVQDAGGTCSAAGSAAGSASGGD